MERPESIKEQVRKHYALKARRVRQGVDRRHVAEAANQSPIAETSVFDV
jgi:hypothetical protein